MGNILSSISIWEPGSQEFYLKSSYKEDYISRGQQNYLCSCHINLSRLTELIMLLSYQLVGLMKDVTQKPALIWLICIGHSEQPSNGKMDLITLSCPLDQYLCMVFTNKKSIGHYKAYSPVTRPTFNNGVRITTKAKSALLSK